MKIFTIGHSTLNLEEFLDILKHFNIELVIDVRRFPSSKKFPWFSKDDLEKTLKENDIQYIHYPRLGGYRKEGYATFARSEEFRDALKKLLEIIDDKSAAILCAEKLFWRCHRKYIANKLVEVGNEVIHILDKEKIREHKSEEKEIKEKMNLKIFCDKKTESEKKS